MDGRFYTQELRVEVEVKLRGGLKASQSCKG
jgi:hypothetical protein